MSELNKYVYTARHVISGPIRFILEGYEPNSDIILMPGWVGDPRNKDHLQVRLFSSGTLQKIAETYDIEEDYEIIISSIFGGGAGGQAYYIHVDDIKFKTVPFPQDNLINIALQKYKENPHH